MIPPVLMLTASCNLFHKKTPGLKPVARVFNNYLYPSDLQGLIPKGASVKDSETTVKKYIKQWTQEQVVLHQAENNLSEQQLDISKQLEDYKNSLIIYAYEKELVSQNLDTAVSDTAIENYYNTNKKDFELKNDIVKLIYVKVNKKAPDIDKLKGWMTSSDIKDRQKLAKYCYQFAENFFLDDNVWLMFDDVLKEVPIQTYNEDLFLQTNHFVNIQDSANIYLLNIKGYMIKNSISPLSFEKDNIRKILLNRRKMQLIEQMRNNLYKQALTHNNIKVY